MEESDKVLGHLCELLPETDGFECHRFKVRLITLHFILNLA